MMESFGSTRASKQQRCIPPRLLMLATVLITLQLLLLATATASDAATTTTDSDCPPATCGDLTITYPFTLGGGGSNSSSCGPPAFRLTCNSSGSGAFLGSSSSYIQVLSIDYGNRSLVAVHVLLAADAGCTVMFNVSSALAIMDTFTISAGNRELDVMSMCGGATLPPPGAVPVTNCSRNSSRNFAYLGGGYGTGTPPANAGSCDLAVFPVLASEADGATSADYRRLLRDGFLLDWQPVGDCNACTASGGRCRYDASSSAFACLCSDGSLRSSTCDGKRKRKLTLIVSMSIVATTTLVFICLAWLIYRHKQRSGVWQAYSTDRSNEEEVLRRCESLAPQRYKYSELKKITKSFKEMLGEGGYGVVFRGSLPDGRVVAVKLLKGSKGNGEDFVNEVMSISQTSHINIVNLIGFCLEGSKRALVYEYMPNGSLEKHIYSELFIGWEMLLKIAIGIARGLEYLHQGCSTRIIHFDIKPHNILLDNEFCPKISDFGLAKLCRLNGSILSTAEARGTIGFIAPEVFSRAFGAVSTKSDVYSYGMMLLEIVRGKTNMKGPTDDSSEVFFPHLLYDHLARDMQGCQIEHGTEEIARKLISVGLYCIQIVPDDRPSMSRVIEMLEKSANELEMPLPPKPFLYSPLQSTNGSSITTVMVSMSS